MRQVATATGLAVLDENADAQGQLENISEEKGISLVQLTSERILHSA